MYKMAKENLLLLLINYKDCFEFMIQLWFFVKQTTNCTQNINVPRVQKISNKLLLLMLSHKQHQQQQQQHC